MNSSHVRRWWFKLPNGIGAVLVLLVLACPGFQPRALAQYSEYEVKAAFLVNFAQFVKWPAKPGVQPSIGILGDDPFGGALERVAHGNIGRSQRLEDLKGCQILFISKSERPRIGQILASLQGTGVLTVSDIEEFARKGGVIGFFMDGAKVRFEINPEAGQKAGLEISSKLMKLGRIVNSG
jgi:hypothetical protein